MDVATEQIAERRRLAATENISIRADRDETMPGVTIVATIFGDAVQQCVIT